MRLNNIMIFLALLTPACAKTEIKAPPAIRVRETRNYIVTISNCGYIISDPFSARLIFYNACVAANFAPNSLLIDDSDNNAISMQLRANNGYAKFYMNNITQTAVLEFYCVDESCDYAEFVGSFFSVLNNIMQKDFDDLLDEEFDQSIE